MSTPREASGSACAVVSRSKSDSGSESLSEGDSAVSTLE